VLIAGVSTRAAAESAARAGFAVTAIDAFGDLDQHPSVRSLTLPRDDAAPFTAHAAADAVRDVEVDAAAYLSPFENHIRAVEALTAGSSTSPRALWGNPPDVLGRVRDPFLLAGVLRRRGFAAPITRVDVPRELAGEKEWLVKPFRSGGGHGVRPWSPDAHVTSGSYAQERISGIPASIVFVAAGGRAVPLGVTRQLIGDPTFGASGYRYCGNLLASADDDVCTNDVVESLIAMASCVTEQFALVGLNGIDCIVHDRVPYVIEVNPRWCSSMELVERQCGVSMFGVHAAACADGTLPASDLSLARRTGPVIGKAIVFAPADVVAGDTRPLLEDRDVRDIPKPGERLSNGQPICTVFAEGTSAEACLGTLRTRAHDINKLLSRSAQQHNVAAGASALSRRKS
jgi:predicted ATP-grasp superfamily ATP-dependent carboligase